MEVYKTMRNTIAAVGLALSGNAMANEITPTDLANKVLAYDGVVKKEGEIQTQRGEYGKSQGTEYTINGLPQLDAMLPVGIPLDDNVAVRVDKIQYRDISPQAPSSGDEIEYSVMRTHSDGITETIQFLNIFGEEGTYTSLMSNSYGLWLNSDHEIMPGQSSRAFQDANRTLVLALLCMETDPQDIKKIRDTMQNPQ